MPYTTLSLGLTLTIPTSGTRNWASTLYSTTWTKISNHGHTGSGDGTKMVTASYTDLSVTTAKIDTKAVTTGKIADNTIVKLNISKNLALTQGATLSPSGTTQTVSWNDGNWQKLSLAAASGNVTVTLSNPIEGAVYKLFVIQGAAPLDVVWPASIKWPQGQSPILSTGSSDIDIVTMYYDGTNYYGDWELDYS